MPTLGGGVQHQPMGQGCGGAATESTSIKVGLLYCRLTGRSEVFPVYMVLCPQRADWAIFNSITPASVASMKLPLSWFKRLVVSVETRVTLVCIALRHCSQFPEGWDVQTGCIEVYCYGREEHCLTGSSLLRLVFQSAMFACGVLVPGTSRCCTYVVTLPNHFS